MNKVILNLPDNLYSKLESLSNSEGIKIDTLIVSFLDERINLMNNEESFSERVKRFKESNFRYALGKIPNIDPPEYDTL